MAKSKNEAKIKFTAETGEFNEQIKKSNDSLSELKAELKLNEAQMKTTGASVEGLEKKHQILSNQLKASESKTEALSQKVDKAAEIYGENSNEVQKLRIQLLNAQAAEEKIKQEINACTAELKQQESSFDNTSDKADELEKSLENVDDAAEEAEEGFTVLKGAMADLVADGIEKVVSGFVEIGKEALTMANDIDSATNSFIAKTGESTESAEEFENAIIDIYNGNYGESFEDISESMATIKTALGDIGAEGLEKITTKAIILRDTFDMDVNESIRGVNSMMDQFGITADEAYNLIAQGSQKGLNQNGDLLDVINEYSVQFANAGYSAEDMFNMLANGVEKGTWSVDKLGDAMKEFNIRMSDGSAKEAVEALGFSWESVSAKWSKGGDSAKYVFNMLFNELDGLENTTEGYGIGVSLLGTMYEDLGQEAILALSSTEGEISKNKNALEEINSIKYNDLGSALEGIGRNIKTGIAEPLNDEVLPAANDFVTGIDWQGVGSTIGNVFSTIVTGAMSAVTWMKEHKGVMIAIASVVGILTTAITAYNIVQGVKNAMDAANVTTVWGLVAAHWAQATAAMAAIAPYILIVAAIAAVIAIIILVVKYWDEIVAAVKRCWESVKATLAQWGSWIKANVIDPVVNFFKGLWESIKSIWDTISKVVQVAIMFIGSILKAAFDIITLPFRFIWENCKEYVFAAWEWIKKSISTAINAVKNVISKVMNAIKTVFSTVWNAIKNVVMTVWNAISGFITPIVNKIKSVVTTAWNGIKNAISNVVNAIKTKVSSVFNSVKSSVSSVFNGIKSTASNVWNGIKNAIVKPIEAAKDKIKGIIDKIKGFFDNLKLKFPNIKMPHFSIKGKFSLDPPSVPKLAIDWYKEGGILTKPTIFGVNGNRLMAGGEAGAEAVLPIDKLEGYISGAIEKTMNVVNMGVLATAIENLASRPNKIYINGREVALATASDGDSINGIRSVLRQRGLAVE